MTRGIIRRGSASRAVIAAILACGSAAAAPTSVEARTVVQDRAVTFDIPAGALAEGLRRYAEVTGLQTVYRSDLVAGIEAPAVRGRYTPEDALAILL